MTAPSSSEVVAAWGRGAGAGSAGAEGAGRGSRRAVTAAERGPHLLLEAAAEVLVDELPTGGRLQLQVPLQSLKSGGVQGLGRQATSLCVEADLQVLEGARGAR